MRYKGINKNIKQTILYFDVFLNSKKGCFDTKTFKNNIQKLITTIYQQDRTIKKHYKIINGLRKTNQDQKDTIERSNKTINAYSNILSKKNKNIDLLEKEIKKNETNIYKQCKSIDLQQREIFELQKEIKAKNTFIIEKHLTSKYAKWLVEYNKSNTT